MSDSFNTNEIKQITQSFLKKIKEYYSNIQINNEKEFAQELSNTLKKENNKKKFLYIPTRAFIGAKKFKIYNNISTILTKQLNNNYNDQYIIYKLINVFLNCMFCASFVSEICDNNNSQKTNIFDQIFNDKDNYQIDFRYSDSQLYENIVNKTYNIIEKYNFNYINDYSAKICLIKEKQNLLSNLLPYVHYSIGDETMYLLNDKINKFINQYEDVLQINQSSYILHYIINRIDSEYKEKKYGERLATEEEIQKYIETKYTSIVTYFKKYAQTMRRQLKLLYNNIKHKNNNAPYYMSIVFCTFTIIISLCCLLFKKRK